MKYNIFLILFFLVSCTTNFTKNDNRVPFNTKGFAYIYNEQDYQNKIIKGKLDNSKLQISINQLSPNSLVKLINPKTKESIVISNFKKINYPDFYKVLITKKVAEKLEIDKNLPLIEVLELKKNKSFVAKKAKIFNEEKKISSNAPVASVEISNISKNKDSFQNTKKDNIYILIASFYAKDIADFLKRRITKEIPSYDTKKLIIRKKSNKEFNLISGPYNTINLVKNDYILLKKFGFEDLDITNE